MSQIYTFLMLLSANGITIAGLGALFKWVIQKKIELLMEQNNTKFVKKLEDIYTKQNLTFQTYLSYSSHVLETQYDIEYNNYMEIWKCLQKYANTTFELRNNRPPMTVDEFNKSKQEQNEKWKEDRKQFKIEFEMKAPFYRQDFYDAFKSIDEACNKLFMYFDSKKYNVLLNDEYIRDEKKKIEQMQNELLTKLREYLQSLNVLRNKMK